ncbi:glutathione S-transferase A-like [Oncorhynchus keta]|uniref:glutathione S-transferase A-like n=1 Tax=Oncorhynchus keta TaxID=8018 RepID=UPI0015FA85A1|nr:glutathione S-transferase A-like [Oncorhynchus keta]
MANNMTLLWCTFSVPCWRVMIALEEKMLQGYNQTLLDFDKEEHKSTIVMDLNPRAQLPTFKHGDCIVNESYGACMYLENQFRSQGTQMIPEGLAEQALMYQRMFEGQTFYEKLSDVVYYEYYVPRGERHDSAIKRNKDNLAIEIQLWEGYFQKMEAGSYLAGKAFSLADVLVFPTIAYSFRSGLSAESYPKLRAYYSMMKDRPSVKTTWPPHWLEDQEKPQWGDFLKEL